MIDRISVEQCTLCGSCYNACPVDAISFKTPYLDFLYPAIDNSGCVGCDRCEKSCPILADKKEPESGYPIAFAARSRDEEARRKSSSVGVFYELASKILSEGGYVCGAVFDEHFHVKHIVSNTQKDLYRMMGSKYAQSDMGMCFRQIKTLLDEGKNVLFTGCPCQVAGLRTYIGRKHPNLLLVELICHGIPSDQMLQTYIGMQGKKYGSRLKEMEFRNKEKGWHNRSVRMKFANHRLYAETIGSDTYMKGFLGSIFLKPACYQCHFRNCAAGSDIVLGDFWGAEVEHTAEDDNKGLSAVLVNTEKGFASLNKCMLMIVPTSVEKIVKYNMNLVQSAGKSPLRSEFYAYAEENGYESAIRCFLEEKLIDKAIRRGRFALRYAWHVIRGKGCPLY